MTRSAMSAGMTRIGRGAAGAAVIAAAGLMTDCAGIGGALQNAEYQSLVEVNSQYDGLENKSVAVLVDADLTTRHQFPTLVATLAEGLSQRLAAKVPTAKVLPAAYGLTWQYRTAQWDLLPYGEMCEQLKVDRIVHVDMFEYRLHPPGNRYEWEGVAGANIGLVESDGLDPDSFSDTYHISVQYPTKAGYGPESITRQAVETVLVNQFIEKTIWLFHFHEEPKYPDKYRPELER